MAIQYDAGCKVKVKHGVLIRKPPEDVYNFVSEADNFSKWQSTLYDINEKKNMGKTDYGADCLQQDARVRDSRNVLGKKIESEYEVTHHEPGKALSMQVVEGSVDYEMHWTFEPFNGGTWFSAEGGGDLGTDTPVSQAVAEKGAQSMLEHDLATLREVLEGS